MAKIQLDGGEYVLETLDQIKQKAKDQGLLVVFPATTQIQIDIDSEEAYREFNRRLDIVTKHLQNLRFVENKPSRSGLPKRHITIDVGMDLSEGQRIALQAALGSDPTRELLNITEHLLGMEHSSLFYERPEVDNHWEQWYDSINDIFYPQSYRMISGIAEQQSVKYLKFDDKNKAGRLWFVGDTEDAAERVYVGFPYDTKSQGFAGRWMDFETVDGEVVSLQGPWHSNSEALYAATGYDTRNQYRTFVVVAKERCYSGGQDYFKGILYMDDDPTLGSFYRYKEIAQRIADERGETVYYYVTSRDGSSSAPVQPTKEDTKS
jgi:hypothetical protein